MAPPFYGGIKMKLYELAPIDIYALSTASHYGYNKELLYYKKSEEISVYDIGTEAKKYYFYKTLIEENKNTNYAYVAPMNDFMIEDKMYYFTAQSIGFVIGTGDAAGQANSEVLCIDCTKRKFIKKIDELEHFLGLVPIKMTKNKARFFGLLRIKTERNSTGKSIMYYQQAYVDADIDYEGYLYNITKTVNAAETHEFQYSTGKTLEMTFKGVVDNKIVLYHSGSTMAFYVDIENNKFESKKVTLGSDYIYSHNGEEKKLTVGTNLIFNDTAKKISLGTTKVSLQYSQINNELYLYGAFGLPDSTYEIRKYRIDLDNQDIILVDTIKDSSFLSSSFYGYKGGGTIYYTNTRSYVIPFIEEAEEDKEKVTLTVPSNRAVNIDKKQELNTIRLHGRNNCLRIALNRTTVANNSIKISTERSSQINSKAKLKSLRQITSPELNIGHFRRSVIVKDNILNDSCRVVLLANNIDVDTIRSSHVNSKSNLNIERKIINQDCNTAQIERKVTENIYHLNDSIRMVSKDVLVNRNTLRVTTDLEVDILKARTLRKIIKEQQSLKTTMRASILNVDSKLNSERRISLSSVELANTQRVITEKIEATCRDSRRVIVVEEDIALNTVKSIVANKVIEINLNRRSIKSYDYSYSTARITLKHNEFIEYYLTTRAIAGNMILLSNSSRLISGPVKRFFNTRRTISLISMDCALYIFNIKMLNSNIIFE